MRILLVDDSKVFLHILSLYFQSSILSREAVIDQAYDGEQALEKYHMGHKNSMEYNAIFLDCDLPLVFGMDVLSHIRIYEKAIKENAPTKIIMMSGRCDLDSVVKSKSLGADFFLAKPIEYPKLKDIIAKFKICA